MILECTDISNRVCKCEGTEPNFIDFVNDLHMNFWYLLIVAIECKGGNYIVLGILDTRAYAKHKLLLYVSTATIFNTIYKNCC